MLLVLRSPVGIQTSIFQMRITSSTVHCLVDNFIENVDVNVRCT